MENTDRKPVDPPPIIQLQISDPADPAQNYLQSPYFFMCCNLCDANLDRPGQLAAAQQGDDLDTASQAALAGTLVSSLHRLKDIDNSDGGFFVFPDVSVRIEGDFRLRFSLFEMLKTSPKVVYIKSITSAPFTVHTPRTFPGMLESTFLSRSFGDQGVKLRIRKEPRVLGKRPVPADFQPPDVTQGRRQSIPSSYGNAGLQSQHDQSGGFGSSTYSDQAAGYSDPHPKRHMPSAELSTRAVYEQDRRAAQHAQQRDSYGNHLARDVPTPNRGSFYPQGASSAPGSDYSFGHQRTGSSAVSSPFVSPRNEYPSYSYAQTNQLYHQPRDAGLRQPYDQYANPQPRQVPQLAQPVPPGRQLSASLPTQPGLTRAYPRSFEALGATVTDPRPSESFQSSRSYQSQAYAPSQIGQSLPRTLPPPAYIQPPAGILPPLGSSGPPNQPRSDNLQAQSSSLLPSMESSAPFPSGSLLGRDSQRYGSGSYRNRPNG